MAKFSLNNLKTYPVFYVFLSLIVFVYLITALKFFSPELQKAGIDQFHLTNKPFLSWALAQPLPSMYSYSNELWVGRQPYRATKDHPKDSMFKSYYYTQINHYPLRIVTFSKYRDMLLSDEDFKYVSLRSVYRGVLQESGYYLRSEGKNIFLERIY